MSAVADEGTAAVLEAAGSGNLKALIAVVKKHGRKTVKNARDESNGDTALHAAVRSGKKKMVEGLLKLGVDVDAQNSETGDTALHLAGKLDQSGIAAFLIKSGANRKLKNNDGDTITKILKRRKSAKSPAKAKAKTKAKAKDNATPNANAQEAEAATAVTAEAETDAAAAAEAEAAAAAEAEAAAAAEAAAEAEAEAAAAAAAEAEAAAAAAAEAEAAAALEAAGSTVQVGEPSSRRGVRQMQSTMRMVLRELPPAESGLDNEAARVTVWLPDFSTSHKVRVSNGETTSVLQTLSNAAAAMNLSHAAAFDLWAVSEGDAGAGGVGAVLRRGRTLVRACDAEPLGGRASFVVRPRLWKRLGDAAPTSLAAKVYALDGLEEVCSGALVTTDALAVRLAGVRLFWEIGDVPSSVSNPREFFVEHYARLLPASMVESFGEDKLVRRLTRVHTRVVSLMSQDRCVQALQAMLQMVHGYGVHGVACVLHDPASGGDSPAEVAVTADGLVWSVAGVWEGVPFCSLSKVSREGTEVKLTIDRRAKYLVLSGAAVEPDVMRNLLGVEIPGDAEDAPVRETPSFLFDTDDGAAAFVEQLYVHYGLLFLSDACDTHCYMTSFTGTELHGVVVPDPALYGPPGVRAPHQSPSSRLEVFRSEFVARCEASRDTRTKYKELMRAMEEADDLGQPLVTLPLRKFKYLDAVAKALSAALGYEATYPAHFVENLQIEELDFEKSDMASEGSDSLAAVVSFFGVLANLPRDVNIRRLSMKGCDLSGGAWSSLSAGIKWCHPLNELDISLNRVGADGARALMRAISHKTGHQVRDLRVVGCELSDEGAKMLSRPIYDSKAMDYLDLSHNDLGDNGITQCLEAVRKGGSVTEVVLSGNPFGSKATGELEKILKGSTSAVRAWILDDCGIPKALVPRFAKSIARGLVKLSLNGSRLGKKACNVLLEALCKNPSSLCLLGLGGNKMDENNAMQVAEFVQASRSLTSLNVADNNLGADGIEAIFSAVGSSRTLDTLNVSNTRAGKDLCANLATHLESNVSLKRLNMSGNPLGNNGAQAFAHALSDNRVYIEFLKIESCKIADAGFVALAEALNSNSRLKKLFAAENKPGTGCVAPLVSLAETSETLEAIDLRGASRKTMVALRDAINEKGDALRVNIVYVS